MFMVKKIMEFVRSAGWHEFVLMLAAASFCVSLWAFVVISDERGEGNLHEMEMGWMRNLRSPENPATPLGPRWLVHGSLDITALGSNVVLSGVTVLVIIYLCLERWFASATFVIFAVGGGTALSFGLKRFFGIERPSVVPHLAEVSSLSYPSGHSMLSSVVYLTLAILLARALKRREVKFYVVSVALMLSFLIGLSRIYLGVHYPTDVLGGWAAGTAWAVLCWLLAYVLERRGKVEKEKGDKTLETAAR